MTDPAATPGHTPKGLECCRGDTCTRVLITARVTEREDRTPWTSVSVTFLTGVPKQATPERKGFFWPTVQLKKDSAVPGKLKWQELEAAGHTVANRETEGSMHRSTHTAHFKQVLSLGNSLTHS